MKDPAQSKTIYQGLSSNKNNVYIKDPVQPNQTVYISWTQLSQQKCIIYQGPSPNLQCKKRLDRWILQKHFSSQKNIFYNWKFSEKRPFRQKKRLFWWKKDLFLEIFWKKSVNRPSHGKKDRVVNTGSV